MFTGIIREIGTVSAVRRAREVLRLSVVAPRTAALVGLGESVAVDGACVSVVRAGRGTLDFELVPETVRRTTLGRLRPGARVNLEPSLMLSDRLNGHLVLGHVDGMGRITRVARLGDSAVMTLQVPAGVGRHLVPKGPLSVDGVSLTVGARPPSSSCELHLIPETLRRTTLGMRRVGERVNLEVDYVAKLVAGMASRRR